MKKVVILVGIPASGKSTIANKLETFGYRRLSADLIRRELYEDENEQGDYKKVFGLLYGRLTNYLALGEHSIVIDNTNIRSKDRQHIRAIVSLYSGYTTQIWLVDIPLEICLERNKNRDRHVPEDVIYKFYTSLQNKKENIRREAYLIIGKEGIDDRDIHRCLAIS